LNQYLIRKLIHQLISFVFCWLVSFHVYKIQKLIRLVFTGKYGVEYAAQLPEKSEKYGEIYLKYGEAIGSAGILPATATGLKAEKSPTSESLIPQKNDRPTL
jgi:hypothetical protein